MTPRTGAVAVVGAGDPAALLTQHLLDHAVPAERGYARGPQDLAPYPLVLMLYSRSEIVDRLWPTVFNALAPGTLLLHLGPHQASGLRRCHRAGDAMGIQIVHAPLTWTTRLNRLYLPPTSRRILAVHGRRATPGSWQRTTVNVLTEIRRADPRVVLGPSQRHRPHAV